MKLRFAASLLLVLCMATGARAGIFTDFMVSAAASAAVSSSMRSPDTMKKVNNWLWQQVRKGSYEEGWLYSAKMLEKSNSIAHIDTAARSYFDNGMHSRAIELYEEKIMPVARAYGGSYEATYRKMIGLGPNDPIDYQSIYSSAPSLDKSGSPLATILWLILLVLTLQLFHSVNGMTYVHKVLALVSAGRKQKKSKADDQ